MTTQTPDKVSFGGNEWNCSPYYPLKDYLAALPDPPEFDSPWSSLNRGYVATWEISNDLLYLKSLKGTLHGGKPQDLSNVFPSSQPPIFADWYTGPLFLTRGAEIESSESDFRTRFECEVFLELIDGVVSETRIYNNSDPQVDPSLEPTGKIGATLSNLVNHAIGTLFILLIYLGPLSYLLYELDDPIDFFVRQHYIASMIALGIFAITSLSSASSEENKFLGAAIVWLFLMGPLFLFLYHSDQAEELEKEDRLRCSAAFSLIYPGNRLPSYAEISSSVRDDFMTKCVLQRMQNRKK